MPLPGVCIKNVMLGITEEQVSPTLSLTLTHLTSVCKM